MREEHLQAINNGNAHAFYKSWTWQTKRLEILDEKTGKKYKQSVI